MKKKKPSTPEKKKVTELPRDLRLGTKISVISDIKFPFSSVTSGETTLRLNEDAAKKILERNTVCAQCSSNLVSKHSLNTSILILFLNNVFFSLLIAVQILKTFSKLPASTTSTPVCLD